MKKTIKIFNDLQNTNGKLEKQRIIQENISDYRFVKLMYFLLNDFITTGLSEKKISKKVSVDKSVDIVDIFQAIDYIKENNTGKDVDIQNINSFLDRFEDMEREFYKQLLIKNLKIGVSASTWNKIANKDLQIPVFDVMLAHKFEDHHSKVKGKFILTKKLDGTRIVVIKENGMVKFFTRQGKEYVGLVEIENDILQLDIDNMVFDGELLADCEGTTNEIFAETLKRSRNRDDKKTGLKFHIFDMLPLEEFQQGISKKSTIQRKSDLHNLLWNKEFNTLTEVEWLYLGDDIHMIAEKAEYAKKMGWEGIMINLDKPYVCKRTSDLLKVKEMQSCDIRVVGFEEGENRNSGTLGALICEYKDNTVKVGTGLSDELRKEIWENKDKWLNRVVEVQYFEETEDSKTKLKSLRFPVFKALREEGKEISYN